MKDASLKPQTNKENSSIFLVVLCMIFIVVLLVSNISASNVFYSNKFFSLSCAEFLFPVSYIINDLLCEFYNFKKVNKIVIIGLVTTFLTTLFLY